MLTVVNWEEYKRLVEKAGALSRLFSSSDIPYLHPRFVEHLYCHTTGAVNLARADISYDAKRDDRTGVGVKTFRVSSFNSRKTEKIAEFTAQAGAGRYVGVDPDEVAIRISLDRNKRVSADAVAYDIDLAGSIYHCLVRSPGACMVHEESYELIDIDSIRLTNLPRGNSPIKFSDGHADYTFSPAKNTLFKTFEIGSKTKSKPIEVLIKEGIFDDILGDSWSLNIEDESKETQDFVVLPLFSGRTGEVAPKSGINQWNAGGRKRSFGEAYIPVPAKIHNLKPGFFPPKDQSFTLVLPNGEALSAKICQEGGKALMTNPNNKLIDWLFAQIDGSTESAKKRLNDARPYTYNDLLAIGRDSVVVVKDDEHKFTLRPGGIGEYQEYLETFDPEAS